MRIKAANTKKVTIGISAYQSESNIARLLTSLLAQDTPKNIEKIIVYCDGCTDSTAKEVKRISSKSKGIITLIDDPENHGYAYSIQKIIELNTSEFLLLLNDDIIIRSKKMVTELLKTLEGNEKPDFICGDIRALPATNFVGRCVMTSFRAFKKIRNQYKNGKSIYTVDGKIMGLTKSFAESVNLIESRITGNVDAYLYFKAITQNFTYAFCRKAAVYHRLPETINDYRNQKKRSEKTRIMLEDNFGEIVKKEFELPASLYYISLFQTFLHHPIESLFFKLIINSSHIIDEKTSFKKWHLAASTKNLSVESHEWEMHE